MIHRTQSKREKTIKGIHIGHNVSDIRLAYQNYHPRYLHLNNGYLMIYDSLSLIFKIDNREKLREWVLFIVY